MSEVMRDATSDLRNPAVATAGVVLRFFLFLLIMKLVFLDWFRFVFSPAENMGRDQEIVRPFDDFTGGPVPVSPRPTSDLPPNIRVYGPGEPEFISPPFPDR